MQISPRNISQLKNLIICLLLSTVSFFYFAIPTFLTPVDKNEIGGLLRHNIARIDDGDGLEIADFSADGRIDIVIAESKLGKVTWYEQGKTPYQWTPHLIAEGFKKIEGLDVLDADEDGRLEVIILDQGLGEVALAEQETDDPRDEWAVEVLDDKAFKVQCSLENDIDDDGDMDFFYAYEGLKDGQGGFFWMEFKGGESLNSENWEKHTIKQVNGGWWINQEFLDLNQDGKKEEIVVTSRTLRNKDAIPGAFWLEPASNVKDPWSIHVIEEGKDFYPLHVSTGNLTGKNHSKDVVLGAKEKGTGVYLYSYSDGYSRSTITPHGTWHNVKALNLDNKGRDEIIVVDADVLFGRRMKIYSYKGGKYKEIFSTRYWKADDRIIPYDLDDDGINEIFTVSAEDNSVDWWEVTFGWSPLNWWEIIFWGMFIGMLSYIILEYRRLQMTFF
ncbi:MAG: FG-GAP repeat domain-containing protein [Promethearchaeia archaeon]